MPMILVLQALHDLLLPWPVVVDLTLDRLTLSKSKLPTTLTRKKPIFVKPSKILCKKPRVQHHVALMRPLLRVETCSISVLLPLRTSPNARFCDCIHVQFFLTNLFFSQRSRSLGSLRASTQQRSMGTACDSAVCRPASFAANSAGVGPMGICFSVQCTGPSI
jgi:hypothetical protein